MRSFWIIICVTLLFKLTKCSIHRERPDGEETLVESNLYNENLQILSNEEELISTQGIPKYNTKPTIYERVFTQDVPSTSITKKSIFKSSLNYKSDKDLSDDKIRSENRIHKHTITEPIGQDQIVPMKREQPIKTREANKSKENAFLQKIPSNFLRGLVEYVIHLFESLGLVEVDSFIEEQDQINDPLANKQ